MKKRTLTHSIGAVMIAAFAVIAITASSATAAIVVESSTIGANGGWAPTSIAESSLGTFSLSGADKLVVTLGGRDGSAFDGVEYNNQALTHAVTLQAAGAERGDHQTSIWYLDNPGTTTGDITWTAGPSRAALASLWALSGTADGVGATGSSSGNSTSLTTTSDNSWVLASAGHNTNFSPVSAPTPADGSSMTEGENLVVDYYSRGEYITHGTGYQWVATAGSVTPSFDIGDTTVAAEFTVIPEPASLSLLMLVGGACFILRRRFRR